MTFKEYKTNFARSGGKARAKSLTAKERSDIARKAVKARWKNKSKKVENNTCKKVSIVRI